MDFIQRMQYNNDKNLDHELRLINDRRDVIKKINYDSNIMNIFAVDKQLNLIDLSDEYPEAVPNLTSSQYIAEIQDYNAIDFY